MLLRDDTIIPQPRSVTVNFTADIIMLNRDIRRVWRDGQVIVHGDTHGAVHRNETVVKFIVSLEMDHKLAITLRAPRCCHGGGAGPTQIETLRTLTGH